MSPRIFLLFLIIISSVTLVAMSDSNSNSLLVMYQQYSSTLQITPSHITYKYSYTTYNTTLSRSNNERTVTYNSYSFDVNVGNTANYTGQIKVTVSPFTISINSQIPQLARVILIEPNLMEELVWSGFTNGSTTVTGIAYFNSTVQLILQFLNGTNFANVTFNISHSQQAYEKSVSLLLHKVTLTMTGETQLTITLQSTYPERYSGMEFSYEGIETEAPYNTSIAYYNGTYVPAMIWEGEASGLFSTEVTQARGNVGFTNIEFFGANGSIIGDLDSSFSSIYLSHQGLLINITYNSITSHLKVIINPNAQYIKAKPETVSVIPVNGNPAVVVITNQGVESTANVNLYHQVVVLKPATLVFLNVTNASGYVMIMPNGSYEYVNQVTPSSVKVTNVSIGGKSYISQVVNVSASGYIVFNVSLARNESVTVFKEASNGMEQLNPNNYFVYNGKVVVFDDPATTYYIVYGYAPQMQASNLLSTPILIYTLIGIIVVVIIAVAILLMLRRK
ncbi:hypothetical protein V6M85_08010 [Sulfolobus tengchongensis]|uniref:Thermopsin n=1 Tax=Sulfolobus tengchongensis TaxID=207809 RepID=A0AAX4KX33_9CREN